MHVLTCSWLSCEEGRRRRRGGTKEGAEEERKRRGEERGGRGVHLPYTIPLMVTDVSAMFVAITTCANNLTVKL